MKITMLGTTGVGKTTFLVAMYNELGRRGRGALKLNANKDLDGQMGLAWRRMVMERSWPDPSDFYQRHNFQLLHSEQPIAEFEFVDYRGGAIVDPSNARFVKDLFDDLDQSDAVMVLADSWYIANEIIDIAEIQNEVMRIQKLIEDFCRAKPRKNLTIAIVLTKYDAIREDQRKLFTEHSFILFQNLIDLAKQKQPRLRVAFIPISVAGYNVAKIEIIEHPGTFLKTVKSTLMAPPRPINVEWPLLYCIAKTIEQDLYELDQSIQARQGEVIDHLNKSNWLDDIRGLITNKPSEAEKARRLSFDIKQDRERLRQLQQRLAPLVQTISILPDAASGQMHLPT